MPFDDPGTWLQGTAAFKNAMDSIRSAIGMIKEVQSIGGGNDQQQKTIENALTIASSSATIAEAQLAQAFGYQLCKCEFPPTPMKTVGYFSSRVGTKNEGDPVYECPKCGYNNAGGWLFTRLAPERNTGRTVHARE